LKCLHDLEEFQVLISSIKSGHRCRRGGWRRQHEEQADPEVPNYESAPSSTDSPVESEIKQEEEINEEPEIISSPPEEPSEPVQPDEPQQIEIPSEFEYLRAKVEIFHQMGFLDVKEALRALVATQGDVTMALERMLQ